ncbi:MAG: hypothetical protein FJ343_00345 [Sphingomonadales bacterium]|nr:hypothetical protein [Sphingomonadales bacterium]
MALAAVVAGIGVDLMEVDAAQYASMGQEMNDSGQWVQLHEHGALYQSRGYPDKPPLVFWAAALGTKVLGATNSGAKIISVIVGLLGIWADSLRSLGMRVEPLQEMSSIKVTRLSLSFLDHRTRKQQCTTSGIYRVIP